MSQPLCSVSRRMSFVVSLLAGLASLVGESGQADAQIAPQGAPVYIRSRLNGMVLDIAGGNRQPGAAIIAYPPNPGGTPNQLWDLVPVHGGVVSIQSRLNGFVLDVKGGNRAPGAEIIAFPAKAQGAQNQHWELVPGPGEAVYVRSRLHGLVLDVRGASRAPGTPIIVWPASPQGSPNQLWDLVPVQQVAAVPQPPLPPPHPHYQPHPHQPPPPPPPAKQVREAGPIWNNGDANGKCPAVCAPPASWSGGWWTTAPGRMSVCECLVPVAYQPQVFTKDAGPIWNNDDANQKCPAVCAPNLRWTGQWRTTVPGRMSVCECSTQ